ncbi:unnamed protein product [Caenorhabditis angaria]|uniref:T20D4.11-like domain-containing protein n=1 Tax=Caenorhabditis angaria TaxID=860376 RepID=A0A9P1N7L2_9PELO|nr:unnamed protein product [Caenorhabditis angaria]
MNFLVCFFLLFKFSLSELSIDNSVTVSPEPEIVANCSDESKKEIETGMTAVQLSIFSTMFGAFKVEPCKMFEDIVNNTNCTTVGPRIPNVIKMCRHAVFTHGEFEECADKLSESENECYSSYLNDKIESGKDYCKNYFGKENCVRQTIIDLCSEDDWKLFKEEKLRDVTGTDCDFSDL